MVIYLGGSILITIFALGVSIVSYNLQINASDGIISLYKKPKESDIDVKNKDIELEMKHDQHMALARYRELVKARREKEKLQSRDPEIYHHYIYKK